MSRPENESVPGEEIRTNSPLIVIDFDRTLADTNACMERFYAAASEIAPKKVQEVRDREFDAEQTSQSFDPLQYFYSMIIPEQKRRFEKAFKTYNHIPLLYEDSQSFLNRVRVSELRYVVLTKAVNADWQRLKIEASGYQGPYIIIDHGEKSKEVNRWRNERGDYALTLGGRRLIAPSVVVLDDKSDAFDHLLPGSSGFLVNRSERAMEPPHRQIGVVTSFDEFIVTRKGLSKKPPFLPRN